MRLLFSSANCLLDSSSGAAISVRTLLRLLATEGLECRSFTASIYDRPMSAVNTDNMRESGAVATVPGEPLLHPWCATDGDVIHLVMPTAKGRRTLQSRQDDESLLRQAAKIIDEFEPDILMMYGGGVYERGLIAMARQRGLPVVFYLANPSYRSAESFQDVAQIFTDTAATRDLYKQKLGLDAYAIGKFVEKPRLPATAGPPPYITFINPSAEKGVTLFYRIAELARQVAPQLQFLVVESRATLDDAQRRTGMAFSGLGNVRRVGLQPDMGGVFARTRILLMPSVWHESGARTAIEACSLGIPIVATDRGGIPEVLGEAGILIPPPAPLIASHWLIPPLSAAIPWVEVLRQLVEDDDWYAERSRLALERWAAHDPQQRVRDVAAILERLLQRHRPAPVA